MLEIDVGNTRLKWRIKTGGKVTQRGFLIRSDFDQVSVLVEALHEKMKQRYQKVRVSSVAGEAFNQSLRAALECHSGVVAEFAVVTKVASGVTAGYDDISLLGVDRWMAILAARHQLSESRLVIVDCGSAVTVDVVDGDQHLGGYIAPGLQLMHRSLFRETAQVKVDFLASESTGPGKNTAECVNHALPLMVVGLIKEIIDGGVDSDCALVLTGGDASVMASFFSKSLFSPELVLDGLEFSEFQ